jgi:hypothetical protein
MGRRPGKSVKTSDIQVELSCGKSYSGNNKTVLKLIEMHKKNCDKCPRIVDVEVEPFMGDAKYGKAGGCLQLKKM